MTEQTGPKSAAPRQIKTLDALLERPVRSIEVEGIGTIEGEKSLIYVREVSAQDGIALGEIAEDAPSNERWAAIYKVIAEAIVTPEGERLIPEGKEDQVGNLPIGVLLKIQAAIMGTTGVEILPDGSVVVKPASAEGNASSGATGSDSSTG